MLDDAFLAVFSLVALGLLAGCVSTTPSHCDVVYWHRHEACVVNNQTVGTWQPGISVGQQ